MLPSGWCGEPLFSDLEVWKPEQREYLSGYRCRTRVYETIDQPRRRGFTLSRALRDQVGSCVRHI